MPIQKCDCENSFMDKKYGFGLRVANKCKSTSGSVYRCCSCGRSIAKSVAKEVKKDKK